VTAALERTFLAESVPVTRADYEVRVESGRNRFSLIAQEIARAVAALHAERTALEKKLSLAQKAFPRPVNDIRAQVSALLAPGWIARTPWARLQHLPRYLKAASLRLEKLRADPVRDARLFSEVSQLEQAYRRELGARARHGASTPELEQFGWLLQELRVSVFAQELRTPVPVSVKRLQKLWQAVRR